MTVFSLPRYNKPMADTIEKLEQEYWDEPKFGSQLGTTCHELRKKPIGQFTASELRMMIGQKIGAQYLMPRALGILESSPLICATFLEGDLLQAVLRLPTEYWDNHPNHLARTLAVTANVLEEIRTTRENNKNEEIRERARQLRLYGAKLDPKTPDDYYIDIEGKVSEFIEHNGGDHCAL